MKKYIVLSLVLIFLFVGVKIVKADDGGPNTNFWAIDNKTHCASFINPEVVGSDTFLVFDYSSKVGQDRGKPWTIIEKGKCYEVEDGSEEVYLVKIVNGNEREIFSNYNIYNSTDNISQKICSNYDCNITTIGHLITPLYLIGETSVTNTASESIHFTGVEINKLFPTKYDFGFPVTSHSSMMPEELKPIVYYPSFVSAENLYNSLAEQLNSTLQSCDSRIRVESQYYIETDNWKNLFLFRKNLIWRLSDNKDVIVEVRNLNGEYTKPDSLNEVELMGCKIAFGAFIQTHQTDFSTIDRLAQEVITKYPNALKKGESESDSDYLSPISLRNNTEISKILAFANNSNTTSGTVTIPPTQQVVTPTVLDEPTPEKKTDILVNSSNPLMRVYVWLPTVALLGILIVLVFKKKKQ